jgi:sulfide:quinone oxidoreductase
VAAEVVVVGGGVAGTLTANLIAKGAGSAAHVSVVDSTGQHVYQPSFLYIPFGSDNPADIARPERGLLRHDVTLITQPAVKIDAETRAVELADGRRVPYDYLVLATGSRTVMEEVPGGGGAHTFYTHEGAERLRLALQDFAGGRVLVGVAGIPYKCPPAPVEFVFLLDDYLRSRDLRERSEIKLLSPLNRAFTIEVTSKLVQPILAERDIELVTFFNVETVDADARTVTSLEGETFDYDLLVLVPPHRGAQLVEDSGLGDARGWIPVDKETLRHKTVERAWALGDATDIAISKSGSVAHYEAPIVAEQIVAAAKGLPAPQRRYAGKVMCFLETGRGRATTINFDYTHDPRSPRPARVWHLGKALFNKTYWHTVPQGRLPD